MAKSKLTIKQDKFVKAYLLNNGNATQAAITAGYSEKTAQQVGSENLLKLVIKEAIESHQKQSTEFFAWTKAKKLEVLESIMNCAVTEDKEKGMINMPSAIAAMKEHNLMQGDNAPIETNTNLKVTSALADRLTGGSKR